MYSSGLLQVPLCRLLALHVEIDDSRHAVDVLPSGWVRVSSHCGSCGNPPLLPGAPLVLWSCRVVTSMLGSPPLQSILPKPSVPVAVTHTRTGFENGIGI